MSQITAEKLNVYVRMTRSRSPLLNNNGLLQEEDIMNRETSFFPSEKIFPSHCSSKRLNDLLLK